MAAPVIPVRAIGVIAATALAAAMAQGAAAEPAAALSPPVAVDRGHATPQRVFQRFYRASVSASRAARRQVSFETTADADSSDIVGDAAQNASDAIVAMAARPDGARWLSQIRDVRVVVGAAPAVGLNDGAIVVTVCPSDGASAQPSSFDIERAVQMAGAKSPS